MRISFLGANHFKRKMSFYDYTAILPLGIPRSGLRDVSQSQNVKLSPAAAPFGILFNRGSLTVSGLWSSQEINNRGVQLPGNHRPRIRAPIETSTIPSIPPVIRIRDFPMFRSVTLVQPCIIPSPSSRCDCEPVLLYDLLRLGTKNNLSRSPR